jgi:hypothetical protein
MHRCVKSIKTVTTGAEIILAILTIQAQLSGQSAQVPRPSSDKTQFSVSKPGNKTPQTGGDIPCVANGSNSSGVTLRTPATPGQHQVDLTWKASSSPGVLKYKVYRCTPTGPCSVITSVTGSSYTDKQVEPKQTYCYFVTAAAAARGPDSAPSNFIQVAIPSP